MKKIGLFILFTFTYLLFGRLGLLYAVPPGFASPIFPPAGIALGIVLVFGPRFAPSILLGSCLMNFSLSVNMDSSFNDYLLALVIGTGIGVGAMVQALFARFLIFKYCTTPLSIFTLKESLIFTLLAGPLSCVINATIGNMVLLSTGVLSQEQLLDGWINWWIGDVIGSCIFGFIFLALFYEESKSWRERRKTILIPTLTTFTCISLLFVFTHRYEKQRVKNDFENISKISHLNIKSGIDRVQSSLEVLSVKLSSKNHIAHKPFLESIEPILGMAGVEGVFLANIISSLKIQTKEEEMQFAYFNSFKIERPKNDESCLSFIQFIEPIEDNLFLLGRDLSNIVSKELCPVPESISKKGLITSNIRFNHRSKPFNGIVLTTLVTTPNNELYYVGVILNPSLFFGSNLNSDLGDKVYYTVSNALNELYTNLKTGDSSSFTKFLSQTFKSTVMGEEFSFHYSPSSDYIKSIDTFISNIILVVGLLFTIATILFFINISGNIYLNNELLLENSKINELLDSSPDAMLVVNEIGDIVFVNSQVSNLFGHFKNELIGQKIELLIPERYRLKHRTYRDQYIKKPSRRPMGRDLELFGLHKSGLELRVEVSISPIKTNEGVLVTCAIREVRSQG